VALHCDTATLERLEWPRLVERLATLASTARGAEACRDALFSPTHAGVGERLAETSEARALLDAGETIPFGGVHDLRPLQDELGRGRTIAPAEALRVQTTLAAARRMCSFLRERRSLAPRVAELATTLPDLQPLEREIERLITPEGELRENASPELARAHRRVREHAREIERRMNAALADPAIAPHLQDRYVTFRSGRPALPIRADARRRVKGLVLDVSASGTTLFVEPESVVDLGNRLRVAESERDREAERILRALAERLRSDAEPLEQTGATLELLDCISARGRLSLAVAGSAPTVAADAPLRLRGLRHPLLELEAGLPPGSIVCNDVELAPGTRGLVISGPNAGGKTVIAKAVGLSALAVRAGLHVPCDEGSSIPVFDAVAADIGDEQDLRAGLSTFSARMANLAAIVACADPSTLVVLDEVGDGTEPGEGAALAQAVLEGLVERGALVVATTHFNRLKELAGSDERLVNASAEYDPETLEPTYRVRIGVPGSSGATWVAERMGLDGSLVERARELLDRDDRKLEALTRGLSELRQELEAERQLAAHVREETEERRAELEARLGALRGAREQALAAMKADLELAYRSASDEIASVVRTLQRGRVPDGRAANRARKALDRIAERTREVESEYAEPERPAPVRAADLVVGARLSVRGLSGEAVLLEPPDRRDRLAVRLGGARLVIERNRVEAARAPERAAPAAAARRNVEVTRSTERDAVSSCDLRGMRVDEALDRADAHLNGLLGTGVVSVTFIHGHGTGALRNAIREWLRHLPEVESFAPGGPQEGGNGVTTALLSH
jgi:DNA mismatch repair protein MutS2